LILPNIGKKTAEKLSLLGIQTIGEMRQLGEIGLAKICSNSIGLTKNKISHIRALSLLSLGNIPTNAVMDHRKSDNPYLSLYGDDWKIHIEKCTSLKSHVCVTTLIQHIVDASMECMRGTKYEDSWVFMHDALIQMTCKSTIQWMKKIGIYHRWILPELDLNIGTIYAGRPVGNSPEFMPWDSSLNKDVDDAFHRHRQLTIRLAPDSPYKFCFSTPNRLDSAYVRLMDPSHGVNGGSLNMQY
jgi:hypothetical protein